MQLCHNESSNSIAYTEVRANTTRQGNTGLTRDLLSLALEKYYSILKHKANPQQVGFRVDIVVRFYSKHSIFRNLLTICITYVA